MAGRGMGAATQGGGAVSSGPRNKIKSNPASKSTGIPMMAKGGAVNQHKRMAMGEKAMADGGSVASSAAARAAKMRAAAAARAAAASRRPTDSVNPDALGSVSPPEERAPAPKRKMTAAEIAEQMRRAGTTKKMKGGMAEKMMAKGGMAKKRTMRKGGCA